MGAWLVPIHQGQRIPLDKAVVFIGRHPDCDVVLSRSRKISRKHCCIAQVNNRFVVRDLGSTNGVRINGQRVKRERMLQLGDRVAIGDLVYVLELSESKQPPAAHASRRRRNVTAESPTASPALPLNLSQDFPVALPEGDDGDDGIQSQPSDPEVEVIESDSSDVSLARAGPQDDAVPLEDSEEMEAFMPDDD